MKTIHTYIIIIIFLTINLVLRFTGLDNLGPFYDESLNILTSNTEHIKSHVSAMKIGRPFLDLLFIKVATISESLELNSLLHAARIQTAAIGFLNSILIALIFYALNLKMAAIVSFTLVSVLPIFVLHERLAVQDPYSTFFFLLSVFFLVLSSKHKNIVLHNLLLISSGGLYALMILNKVSGLTVLPYYFAFYSLTNNSIININTFKKVLVTFVGFIAVPFIVFSTNIFNFCGTLFNTRHSPIPALNFYSLYKKLLDLILYTPNIDFIIRYNSFIFIVIIFLVWLLGLDNKKFKLFSILSALGFFLATFAYSSLGYARYYHVDCYQLVAMIALGINSINFNSLKKAQSLILIILFLSILGVGILRNYTEIRAQKVNYLTNFNSEGDYKQYVSSYFSGYNFQKLKAYFADKNDSYIIAKISPSILGLELLALKNINMNFIYLYEENAENELLNIINTNKIIADNNLYILDDTNYWSDSKLTIIPAETIVRNPNINNYTIYKYINAKDIK